MGQKPCRVGRGHMGLPPSPLVSTLERSRGRPGPVLLMAGRVACLASVNPPSLWPRLPLL